MFKWFKRFDELAEAQSRRLAQNMSRRHALNRISRIVVGAAFVLPVLPFDRSEAHASGKPAKKAGNTDDPTQCEYWRYCAIDGFLCSCCGGSLTQCPPGTEASKVSWIGTCHNPKDGKDYLVSYNDCCGKTACGNCMCNTNMRERPGYSLGVHNDINWCMSNDNSMFHCTTSVVVGLANE